jgi:hypothetical protein
MSDLLEFKDTGKRMLADSLNARDKMAELRDGNAPGRWDSM